MGIFSTVINEVEDAVNTVTKQAGQISGIKDALNSALNPISGGAWTGKGAQAFEEEMQSLILPQFEGLAEQITGLAGGINSALEIVKDVDALTSVPVDAVESAID